MTENPALAAMEAYMRTHPHRADEVEEAMASFDPDSEAAELREPVGVPAPAEVASEQLALVEDAAAASAAAITGQERALNAERAATWRLDAESWFEAMAIGTTFTGDELVRAVGLPGEGVYGNNAVGGWFAAKSRAGVIEFTGRFSKSKRQIGHGNLQRVWVKTG